MDFKTRYQYNPKTDLLGKGGFARVFKAYDQVLLRYLALKVFSVEVSEKYDLVSEIRKVISLEHPNLCRYYDVAFLEGVTTMGEEEKLQVGIMEYLDSGDLKTYCAQHPEQLNKLFIDVLQGLAYLHEHGIIHRDLKPQNVLIKNTPKGPVAKITDFGISKDAGSGNTSSSQLMGTIEYMAPEQFSPLKYGINGKIGTNLDLWSFGLMVYELVTGESMFGSRGGQSSAEQVMSNILNEELIEEKIKLLPEPYQTLVSRCLVKDAKQRVQSADELSAVLNGTISKPAAYDSAPTKVINKTALADRQGEKETKVIHDVRRNAVPEVVPEKKANPLRWAIGIAVLLVVVFVVYRLMNPSSGAISSGLPIADSIAKNMVPVQGGSFDMGSNDTLDFDAKPVHRVTLKDFSINKYDVTQAQWKAIMGNNPSNFQNCDGCPVEQVSWDDVQGFIEKLNQKTGKHYRLPTEAEWEYAARGGNKSNGYAYSGSNNLADVAWFADNSSNKTHPVGQKQANELGLYDMTGNVWQWCQDWYDKGYYSNNTAENPPGPATGSYRVFRGGGWLGAALDCRVAFRIFFTPGDRDSLLGFRLVLVP